MKRIFLIMGSLLVLTMSACSQANKEDKKEAEMIKPKITLDLLNGETPKHFTAKTTDGSTFNSAENKGKYWAVFVYDKSYLVKSDSYDMVAELKETIKNFGDKIPMLVIVNGFSDDEPALKKMIADAKISIKQIDNTEGPAKEKPLDDNVFCTPAKILIDPSGKVIYNGCGGKTNTFDVKLDSLVKANKL
ncbi:peroxiredoxin family protein [Pedobacter namyangjuensis]|uniref:peroxiredoxin family protein n=1 Tax=Pedobacter namyangjuensis TaxID=600626 RepID=UPI0013B39E51|nr:AhpC/TSA family protein [Pedobacter namyangjuensis]